MDSILQSVKQLLGVNPEYSYFDKELIMLINSVLMILKQLGVGPEQGFQITNAEETWNDFLGDDELRFAGVRAYVAQKVRLMWDTQSLTGAVLESFQKNVAEFEWRLNAEYEGQKAISADSGL